jgi:DNA-directed RNA polymerase specialized sigma24 family protein
LRFVGRVDARDPEDVVQTVFLRVLRIAGRFHADTASARPWLFAIATHVSQERSRALRRAMLAIPVGTVWTRLHHARRELRRFMTAPTRSDSRSLSGRPGGEGGAPYVRAIASSKRT